MADWDLSDLAQELSDLAVALLLCLIAHEHPLIETTDECLGDVAQELALVCFRCVCIGGWEVRANGDIDLREYVRVVMCDSGLFICNVCGGVL